MAKAKTPSLKKNPEVADYVVEATNLGAGSMRQVFEYFVTRKEARAAAKSAVADRVRVFHMTFKLVSDRRAK